MMGFTRITAPFAGIVTSRSAQIGALVSAGNGAAKPLFTVADVSHLRVYVNVPQNQSGRLTKGLVAQLTVPEHPGEIGRESCRERGGKYGSITGVAVSLKKKHKQ